MNKILSPFIIEEKNSFLIYLKFCSIIKYFRKAIFDILYNNDNNNLILDFKRMFLKQSTINHLIKV